MDFVEAHDVLITIHAGRKANSRLNYVFLDLCSKFGAWVSKIGCLLRYINVGDIFWTMTNVEPYSISLQSHISRVLNFKRRS